MRTTRYLLGGALALALALSGALAFASESPQGFKGGYALADDCSAYACSHAAIEAHPELKADYHERTTETGRIAISSKHMTKGGGYVLREVKPFSASSIRSHATS